MTQRPVKSPLVQVPSGVPSQLAGTAPSHPPMARTGLTVSRVVSSEENLQSKAKIPPAVFDYFSKIEDWRKQTNTQYTGNVATNNFQMFLYSQTLKLFKEDTINVCETGFNGGHSASLFLLSDPRVRYYGWDLGVYSAAKVVAKKLSEEFPGRLQVMWGDSKKTVPSFFEQNSLLCDLVVIDGEHSYNGVQSDLGVISKHMKGKWQVFVDDCEALNQGILKAFDEAMLQLPGSHIYKYKNSKLPSPGFCQASNFVTPAMLTDLAARPELGNHSTARLL
ncbi:hypothetical protein GUITHDRAFT_153900 [Guillardia theta CCMP2712]|uniref:Class I SAM-dependent methyltransferase n=1 Tax=Guillardia theta (strain CCMP2712) TaxID=905079 RepID=L1IZE0_GUITC|nr:hypothetical protein GUITHDRAFT_153900 [Guillardia theta CCMP2712]EKX41259.1 hypothetical protein GUITHDRAFT_153900 [Guillardia theta CCMP2712]|eukprot:XP_005828239.1 hypothetical protein GUITHDRAFT_153900 [Guillardia theta CCMP2712]